MCCLLITAQFDSFCCLCIGFLYLSYNKILLSIVYSKYTLGCLCSLNYSDIVYGQVWSASTGECMHKLTGHSDVVRTCAFSPKGRFLVSGSDDTTIKVQTLLSVFVCVTVFLFVLVLVSVWSTVIGTCNL